MKACAYCDSVATLTREHLWPGALHRRFLESEKQEESIFYLGKIKKTIPREPTVKDVCAKCNNEALSELDAYICELFDRYFKHRLARHDTAIFEYDYHRLIRWLLKMSYNTMRINNPRFVFPFTPLRPYILGTEPSAARPVLTFVELAFPGEIPVEESSTGKAEIYHPLNNRSGYLWFIENETDKKLLMAVHLKAYSFYTAFFPDFQLEVIQDFASCFLNRFPEARIVNDQGRLILKCNGMDAWQSIRRSRTVLE